MYISNIGFCFSPRKIFYFMIRGITDIKLVCGGGEGGPTKVSKVLILWSLSAMLDGLLVCDSGL